MSVRFPALMLTLFALAACGGGSSGGGSGDTSPQAGSSTFITQENTPGTGLFNATVAAGRTPAYTIVQNGTRGTAVVSDQAAGEFTYQTLIESGYKKVAEGVTTIEEVDRVSARE